MLTDFLWLSNLGILTLGLYNLILGGYGLRAQRPVVYPSRRMFWPLGVVFAALVLSDVSLLTTAISRPGPWWTHLDLTLVLTTIFLGAMLISQWKDLNGYTCTDVDSSLLREGVLAALGKTGIAYEEQFGSIKLPALQAELHVSLQRWAQSGQLELTAAKTPQPVLQEIAAAMRAYYAGHERVYFARGHAMTLVSGVFLTLLALAQFSSTAWLHS